MLREQLSFFTRMPAGKHSNFDDLSKKQFMFPFIGLLIGLSMYLVSLALSISPLTVDMKAVLLMAFLYYTTGILHIDGISDFFDGVVKSGSESEKVEAMMDPDLGVAGILAALFVLLLFFVELKAVFSFGYVFDTPLLRMLGVSVPGAALLVPLVVSEVTAKLSMNTATMFSRPIGESSAKPFMEAMNRRTYTLSILTASLIVAVLNPVFLPVMAVSQAVPLYFVRISERNYGGGNGDMIGASNEVTRIFALLVLALL